MMSLLVIVLIIDENGVFIFEGGTIGVSFTLFFLN